MKKIGSNMDGKYEALAVCRIIIIRENRDDS